MVEIPDWVFILSILIVVGFAWSVYGCLSDIKPNSVTTCKEVRTPQNITQLEEEARARGEDRYVVDLNAPIKVQNICTTRETLPSDFCGSVKSFWKNLFG
jgi:hypothetical protein